MEAASTSWRSVGDILVDRGLISPDDLERALEEELATDQRLTDILVRRGLVSGHDITDALLEQMKHFDPQGTEPRPVLKAVDDEPEGDFEPEVALHYELAYEEPAADDLAPSDEPGGEPEHDDAASVDVLLTKPPEEIIRETDERRQTAESRLTMLGGIGDGLERLRGELEAQDLVTPPLVRELEATQQRVSERTQALTDEIAHLQRTREAVERTSGELEELRAELDGKLNDLSELQTTAAMWNSRVADVEAEVNSLVARIDSLALELARVVGQVEHVPAMQAVTETHAPVEPEPEQAPATEGTSEQTYLLFVPQNDSYDLVERDGPPPAVGESIEVGDATWLVTKVGPSPLPYDERPCVFFSAS